MSETALSPPAQARSKHSIVPVLIALFLLSYALMVLLIVEQGHTIQSQRVLLQQLLVDSTELSHLKAHAQRKAGERAGLQTRNRTQNDSEGPSSQSPTHEHPKDKTKSAPQRPTMPASDKTDVRRVAKLV